MDKLVSIIIPAYNCEKYISKCINSVVNQTYKNIEIIIIDDGSKDNSSVLCDEYAKEYNFITVIHKENGGLSDARNYGLKNAKGKYIFFIDSDDFIDDNTLTVNVNRVRKKLEAAGLKDFIKTKRGQGYMI